jgi:hypothetical protein
VRMGRGGVHFGLFVLALFEVMARFPVVVCSGLVLGGRGLVMSARWVLCRRCSGHSDSP